MCKQTPLISSGTIILLCKYYTVISDTLAASILDVLSLLLAVILSELHGNQEGIKFELQEKVHERIRRRALFF